MADEKINSKLLDAINSADLKNVEGALAMGADPNLILPNGNPLFVEIAFNGDLELVKLFIKKSVNINIKNPLGQTALSGALMNQNSELLDLLLSKGASVDGTDALSAPLAIVITTDDLVSAEKLLKKGANPNATYLQNVDDQMRSFLAAMLKNNLFKNPEKGMRIFVDEESAKEIVSKKLSQIKVTPLSLAKNGKSEKMVALLKKFGAK